MTCVHRVLVEIEKRKKRKKEIANATWQIRTHKKKYQAIQVLNVIHTRNSEFSSVLKGLKNWIYCT